MKRQFHIMLLLLSTAIADSAPLSVPISDYDSTQKDFTMTDYSNLILRLAKNGGVVKTDENGSKEMKNPCDYVTKNPIHHDDCKEMHEFFSILNRAIIRGDAENLAALERILEEVSPVKERINTTPEEEVQAAAPIIMLYFITKEHIDSLKTSTPEETK